MHRFLALLAALTGALAVFTAAWPEWLEATVGLDPDRGSGAWEWSLVIALGASCCALLARRACSTTP